jgi:bifunctional enzyme Fae/Hps
MLDRRQKYLQIALNSTLEEARAIISQIPLDKRIIIEAGTPLIKTYGLGAIQMIRTWWEERILGPLQTQTSKYSNIWEILLSDIFKPPVKSSSTSKSPTSANVFVPYIVADLKSMDRGEREVKIAKEGGANAAVVLGQAPIETINAFIEECKKVGLDSMIDMMNVEYPLEVLRKLKTLPTVVILHRGVDEEIFNPESEIPYHEIQRIKSNYDILVAVAGGDTIQEVQRAIFNDADIVVVWKSFYQSTAQTAKLAEDFLKEIK